MSARHAFCSFFFWKFTLDWTCSYATVISTSTNQIKARSQNAPFCVPIHLQLHIRSSSRSIKCVVESGNLNQKVFKSTIRKVEFLYNNLMFSVLFFFFMPTTLKWNSYVVNEFRMVEMYEFGGIFTRYLLIEWCHRYTRAKEVTPIIFHTIAKPCELACMCIGFASIGLSTLSYFVNDGVKSKFHSVSLSDFSFAQWSITISRIQVDRALINVRMKKHDA